MHPAGTTGHYPRANRRAGLRHRCRREQVRVSMIDGCTAQGMPLARAFSPTPRKPFTSTFAAIRPALSITYGSRPPFPLAPSC